jgi:hypothetical protein
MIEAIKMLIFGSTAAPFTPVTNTVSISTTITIPTNASSMKINIYGNGGDGGIGRTTPQGGAGGGGFSGAGYSGGSGGKGVVIISIPTASYSGSYTGSNVAVTTSGSNTIVSYYDSGTYTA